MFNLCLGKGGDPVAEESEFLHLVLLIIVCVIIIPCILFLFYELIVLDKKKKFRFVAWNLFFSCHQFESQASQQKTMNETVTSI